MNRSPCKRPRARSAPSVDQAEVQRIVRDLNQTVTSGNRLRILQDIFRIAGYNQDTRSCANPQVLDNLVEAGAVNALCLQLGFVLNKRDPCLEDLICRAIGLLYSCSSGVRAVSLEEIGPDLVVLLRKAIDQGSEDVAREVMVTWRTCADSTFGSFLLLKEPGLLSVVVNALRAEGDDGTLQSEALGVLKHMTYYAEDHRLRVLEEPGLVCCLSQIPFQSRSCKAMERLSAVIRNLALSPNTRVAMAHQNDLLSALIRLASISNRRTTRNIMSTLNSLMLEAECCVALLMHGDGIWLNVLSRLISQDEDDVVRRRAARVLRFMARDSCLPLVITNVDLMKSLSACALSDTSPEVRMEAAEAFTKCATLVHAPMPQHGIVLQSLTELAVQPTTLTEVVARALKEQAGNSSNRVAMASHEGLLEALGAISMAQDSTLQARMDAISALNQLSCEKANLTKMATPAVLGALVKNASDGVDNHVDASSLRDDSMKALLTLASVPANRKAMVTQDGLLKMLVHYAAFTADASAKATVKETILCLVPVL